MYRDLTDPRWMVAKAVLLAAAGLLACAGILVEEPTARTALLLALAIACFCRLYYFFFYVIEKYIDPTYRFAGLWLVVAYLRRRGRPTRLD